MEKLSTIINNPQILIYKTYQNRPAGVSGTLGQLTLGFDKSATTHLSNLSISGGTTTEPTTCSLSFFVGIEDLKLEDGKSYTTFNEISTTNNPVISYNLMDHIEIFYSPNNTPGTITKFDRLFMGVVKGVSTNWTPGEGVSITLTANGLFYWLDLIKIQPKTSLFEYMLRNQTTSPDNAARLLSFSTKYDGYKLFDIIRAILSEDNNPNDPTRTDSDYIYLQSWNMKDVLTMESNGSNFLGNETALLNMQADIKNIKNDMNVTGTDKTDMQATTMASGPYSALQKIVDTSAKSSNDLLFKNMDSSSMFSASDSATLDTVRQIAFNAYSKRLLGNYWDSQALNLIKSNMVAIPEEETANIVAFPISPVMSYFLNGTYNTRLEFLRSLADMSFYEIYQAPQGIVYIKPPLYNAIPVSRISGAEISSIANNVDRDSILTSVTVNGLMTAATNDSQIPEVSLKSNFPWIIGSYSCIYPKWYTALGELDIAQLYFDISSDSVPLLLSKLFSMAKNNATTEANPIIVKLRYGTREKTTSFYIKAEGPNYRLILMNKSEGDNAIPFLARHGVFNYLLNSGISDNILYSSSATAWWNELKQQRNQLKAHYYANLDVEALYTIYATQFPEYVSKSDTADTDLLGDTTSTISNEDVLGSLGAFRQDIDDFTNSRGAYVGAGLWEKIETCVDYDHTSQLTNIQVSKDIAKATPNIPAYINTLHASIELPVDLTTTCQSDINPFKAIEPGEWNMLEHGIKDTVVNNNLVRSPDQATSFARYFLYKNNVAAETVTIVLNTIRTDIHPGFNVYNELDACVYYVSSISFNITIGGSTTTTLTCIAKRKPLWRVVPHVAKRVELDDATRRHLLYKHDGNSVGFTEDPWHTKKDYDKEFLGWQYYGVGVKDKLNSYRRYNTTSNAWEIVERGNDTYFLPLFGAPTFRANATSNSAFGNMKAATVNRNLKILKATYLLDFSSVKRVTTNMKDLNNTRNTITIATQDKKLSKFILGIPTANIKNTMQQTVSMNSGSVVKYLPYLDELATLNSFLILESFEPLKNNIIFETSDAAFKSTELPQEGGYSCIDTETLKGYLRFLDLSPKLMSHLVPDSNTDYSAGANPGVRMNTGALGDIYAPNSAFIETRKDQYIEQILATHRETVKLIGGGT